MKKNKYIEKARSVVSSPVLSTPERVKFEGAAEGNDQQEAADQTANQSSRNHFPGHRCHAVPLITPV